MRVCADECMALLRWRTRVLLRLLQLYLQQDPRKIRNKSATMICIVKRVRGCLGVWVWVGVGV